MNPLTRWAAIKQRERKVVDNIDDVFGEPCKCLRPELLNGVQIRDSKSRQRDPLPAVGGIP